MKSKLMVIMIASAILLGGAGYLIFNSTDETVHEHSTEKQLYTCGMHPEIISDEPGNCPICEMKLTPIKKEKKAVANGERKILYWRAPMNPNEIYDKPGKSNMGMDLVPVYEDEKGSAGVVSVDGTLQQTMNLKTIVVQKREFSSDIVTNGVLHTDERKEAIVTTKVGGWIEKLFVNYTGQKIKKGEPLLSIYSPDLVAAQQELLAAISYNKAVNQSKDEDILSSGNELIKNAVRKLELLDVSKKELKNLIDKKEVKTHTIFYAPFNGTVMMKNIIEGEKIMPGKKLLHIADLSELWLKADVYENEIYKVEPGSKSQVKFSSFPGEIFSGKVSFIDPVVDPKTRVLKVRIDLPNKEEKLKPAMFGNVTISGINYGSHPAVDESSVIRSGKKNIVVIALGEGKFKPVEVKLGVYSNGYYQALEGIKEGDEIVTSAQFLIDSESSLKAAINQFGSSSATADEMAPQENDHKGHEHHKEMTNEYGVESELIRTGIIDVESIDKNGDGKVFQDPMDWNVISDKPGRCPVCDMKLVEVTIAKAKENLIENGYKVK
ncbi:MAG: efflux RND transporter periplasmic adaptor subunit [Rhodothermaceae bacterium]